MDNANSRDYWNAVPLIAPSQQAVCHFQNSDVLMDGIVEDSRIFYADSADFGSVEMLEILARSNDVPIIARYALSFMWGDRRAHSNANNLAAARLLNDSLIGYEGGLVTLGGKLDLAAKLLSGSIRTGLELGYAAVNGSEFVFDCLAPYTISELSSV